MFFFFFVSTVDKKQKQIVTNRHRLASFTTREPSRELNKSKNKK